MLKTLDGALALLTHFTARQPSWGVRGLARHSGVHHAVVHRVLATFAANGFLVQDAVGRYGLGLRWFELGQVIRKTSRSTRCSGASRARCCSCRSPA